MASVLNRAIAAIADFNNPFYAEERQRDVANEAAAFGFGVLVLDAAVRCRGHLLVLPGALHGRRGAGGLGVPGRWTHLAVRPAPRCGALGP